MNYQLFRIFNIDFKFEPAVFIAFITGIVFGALLIVLFYIYAALRSLRKSRYVVVKGIKQIPQKDIEEMIKTAQSEYLADRKKEKPVGLDKIIKKLVLDIATLYHPKSKTPLLELTLDETILLSQYIINRLDELLSKRAIKMFKKMRVSTAVSIAKINQNKAVKTAKKYKIPAVIQNIGMVLNLVNPFYWFKKGVIDTSLNLILKKISLIVIAVCGQETYRIFSKQVLVDDETMISSMIAEIDCDFADIKVEKDTLEFMIQKQQQKDKKKKEKKKVKI